MLALTKTEEMKTLKFSIRTTNKMARKPFEAPAGVRITKEDCILYFSDEGLVLLTITIEIARSVVAPVVAMWLYDRFIKPVPASPPNKPI